MSIRLHRWPAKLVLAAAALLFALAPALADGPQVRVDTGALVGSSANGVDKFLGIPYAAPPVGDLRWQAPAPARAWNQPRDATRSATRCSAADAGDGPRVVNEDCLYLDLYRPASASGGNLPVIVFFHGGSNSSGSPDIYDGSRMAKVGNAIVVLPAFRLGNFGFLALPSLTAEGKGNGSGGYGFLDQLAALQWVKRNIAAFGGDPAQVTIAGQSSGGTDVCGLMASPAANGLYSRAIVESGLCGVNVPLAAAEKAGSDLAAKLGCGVPATAAACLREKPADQILDAAPAGFPAAPSGTALLPEAPLTAFADGKFQHVPMVIGFTRDEWWPLEHAAYPMDEAKFKAEVTGQFKNAADKVMSLYPVTAYPHIEYALGAIRTDVMFACPAFALADAAAVYAPVSMYEFADRTAPPFKSLGRPQPIPPGYQPGAFHTAELQYLLGYKAAAAPLNPDQLALADKMIHLWTGFARGYADSGWNAYSKDKRVATILQLPKAGDIQDSVDVFAYHKCDYWNG